MDTPKRTHLSVTVRACYDNGREVEVTHVLQPETARSEYSRDFEFEYADLDAPERPTDMIPGPSRIRIEGEIVSTERTK
jgi:hypothetical protein